MKFQHLPIGASFLWQGERYTKTGPLAAQCLATGAQRIIPRSAALSADTPDAAPPASIDNTSQLIDEPLQTCEAVLSWLNQQLHGDFPAELLEQFSQTTMALRRHQASR